jgi:hypothetical protein
MLTLHFDGQALGAPGTIELKRDGGAEVWHAVLVLHAATAGALAEAVAEMQALTGRQGALELQAGDTVVRALEPADCRAGPVLASVTAQDREPGAAQGTQRVALVFKAERQDADEAVQSHTFTVRAMAEAGRPALLIQAGRAILRRGEDPAEVESLILPVIQPGWRRTKTHTTRDTHTSTLEYECTDEQVFHPLPADVEDGHYTLTEAGGVRTLKGFFVGPGARARALQLAPLAASTHSISENPFTRRVDFAFTEPVDTHSESRAETLTFTTLRKVIDHPLLAPARGAYRQQVGAPQTEVVQEGAAVGVDRHPSPPPPRYASDVIERRVHYSVPHPGTPPSERFVTRWRYVSRATHALAETAP